MEFKKPLAIMIAETSVQADGVERLLKELGAPEWETDAPTGSEEIVEIGGRLCYKSFAPGLNANVTKVREGNEPYLENVLNQKHGSVLEHATVSFVFLNVTRVFTHEIVRHRAGTAFSQESLRYVRLEDLGAYLPKVFDDTTAVTLMQNVFNMLEVAQRTMADDFDLDKLGMEEKKKLTSAMRRLAPIGLTTNILVTANHRAWRHIVGMRCTPHAEEEIFDVMMNVARQLKERFPNLYQDMALLSDGAHFENEKV